MNKRYQHAAEAAAVVTAIETEDFSENTARKLSLFADVFIRELEETEKPGISDFKRMGEDLERIGKKPSVLSRGNIVCLNDRVFYEYAAAAIQRFALSEDYKSVQAANEFVEYMKREIFGKEEI